MKHKVDPNNDFVVKMIFSRQQKSHILVHFLNSVIEPPCPIVEVYIQDPHKHRQTENDKLMIADSLAKDSHGNLYQVEIQNYAPSYLGARMAFTSHGIYSAQLESGDGYIKLRPIHSIWLLNSKMFEGPHYRHYLEIKDFETKAELPQSKFHIFELNKWQPETPLEQMDKEQLLTLQPIYFWLYFMKEAKHWTALPSSLNHISILRELMEILEEVSDREENWARYLSAQDAMRVKITDELLRKEAEEGLIEAKEELSETQGELTQAKGELTQAKGELTQAKGELTQAKGELTQTKGELTQTKGELTQVKRVISDQGEQLEQKDNQLKAMREKLIAAGIDPDKL